MTKLRWKVKLMFPAGSICVVGNAKASQQGRFSLCFIVDKETGVIVDSSSTVAMEMTRSFLRHLFIGKSLQDDEMATIAEIEARYYGSSISAVVTAFKDACRKFCSIRRGIPLDLTE